MKKFYESNHNWIFKIEKISDIIFKIPANEEIALGLFKNRCQNIELGKALCKKLSLNMLNIPDSYKINENLLAERKLKFIKNNEELDKIYSLEKIRESIKQFVIFICETGLSDTHRENFKFMADGSGIALYDLEFMKPESPENGLTTLICNLPNRVLPGDMKELIKVYNFKAHEKMWP